MNGIKNDGDESKNKRIVMINIGSNVYKGEQYEKINKIYIKHVRDILSFFRDDHTSA